RATREPVFRAVPADAVQVVDHAVLVLELELRDEQRAVLQPGGGPAAVAPRERADRAGLGVEHTRGAGAAAVHGGEGDAAVRSDARVQREVSTGRERFRLRQPLCTQRIGEAGVTGFQLATPCAPLCSEALAGRLPADAVERERR